MCALVCAIGCNDTAVVLRVHSNQAIDGLCVGLDAGGTRRFGRRYDLAMQPLPQTLSVLAGGARDFTDQVVGFRRGIPQAHARQQLAFRDSQVQRVEVSLDTCAAQPATPAAFHATAHADGAFDRALVSVGPAGPQILAVGAGQAARFGAGLMPLPGGTGTPPAAPSQLVAADVDGDCQEDAVLLTGPAATLWTRAADGAFVEQPGALPAGRAAASADFDGDGNQDLVVAGGGNAHLLLGDGSGHFREQPSAFDVPPTDVTAVAAGDLDGDGNADLVFGQGSATAAASRIYLNEGQGSAHFAFASAALPPRAERATALALGDVDGDGDLDLFIAHAGGPVRLYINRGNAFLEDRSFRSLPDQVAADVPTLLLADLNLDCLPDLVVPRAGAAPLVWLNAGGGQLTQGPPLDGAVESRDVAAEDLDGDGLPELVLTGAGGVTILGQSR